MAEKEIIFIPNVTCHIKVVATRCDYVADGNFTDIADGVINYLNRCVPTGALPQIYEWIKAHTANP